jgi:hypothetical protein
MHRAVESRGSQAVLIFDDGDARNTLRLTRKLAVFNYIKSRYGCWPDGKEYKNFPLINFIEDPVFRVSKLSYLIQAVDFCAYALFQKEKPTASRLPFGLNRSFENHLGTICIRQANSDDPFGIIR